jgi:signal transduction histidine kinase
MVGLGLGLFAVLSAALAVFTTPSLGVRLKPAFDGIGVEVHSVSPHSVNADRIRAGDTIVSLETLTGERIALSGNDQIEEPDTLNFREFNDFLDRQGQLHTMLQQGELTAHLSDGRELRLASAPEPTRSALLYLMVQAIYGLSALCVALGIWVFRPQDCATRLYAASGVCVFILTLTMGVYGGRDLALSREMFLGLSIANHLATLMAAAFLTALVWVYPRPITSAPVPALCIVVALCFWFADIMQVGPGAAYTIYLPCALAFAAGSSFCVLQWQQARGRPLDQAVVKWFLAALFSGSAILTVLVLLPPIMGAPPLVSIIVGFAAFLIVYFGMAAGISRYRLFDVDRWWFRFWLWFAGGLAVLLLDVALVTLTGMAEDIALVFALATVGWCYFPLRQWLMDRIARRSRGQFNQILKDFVDEIFSRPDAQRTVDAWPELLQRTFSPLLMESMRETVLRPRLSNDGTYLLLPGAVARHGSVRLGFADEGGRLFQREDIETAELLLDLTRAAAAAAEARDLGAHAERKRIMRDLHDDLGARLLNMVYATSLEECRESAREALVDMHGVIDAATGAPSALMDVIASIEGEVRRRLTVSGFALDWHVASEAIPAFEVQSRWSAHLKRIVREAVSNVIRHAQKGSVRMSWHYSEGVLTVVVEDEGAPTAPVSWNLGNGTRAMRARADELNGCIRWSRREAGGCTVTLDVPIGGEEAQGSISPMRIASSVASAREETSSFR